MIGTQAECHLKAHKADQNRGGEEIQEQRHAEHRVHHIRQSAKAEATLTLIIIILIDIDAPQQLVVI